MKIVVIDGQGGRLGKLLIEALRDQKVCGEIIAVGTNSIATAAMVKAGADAGATGEHPVEVCVRDADFILGPIGILAADSLLGEVTDKMAVAIGRSPAQKILVPLNRCRNTVVGLRELTMSELVAEAVDLVLTSCKNGKNMLP